MTVTAGTSRSDYLGDGVQTEFPVGFQALVDVDLAVYLTDPADISHPTKLVLNMHYAVAGNLAAGTAAIHLVTPPASGIQVSILRDIAISQATNYEQYDDFPADSHERALDKLTMICQALQEWFSRAVTYPVGSTLTGTTIPEPEAARVLAWDAEETALINGPTINTIEGAQASASSAAASALTASVASTAALVAQSSAESAEALAQEWSTNPEDTAVTGHPGEYSAYHWSKKAETASSGGLVKVSANDTTLGYIEAKITASTGIVMETQDDGMDEARSIAADVGTTAGKLVQLDSEGALPAVSAKNLTDLPSTSSDGSAFDAFVAWIAASRASGARPGGYMWLFAADELATKTNASYDATGRYYHNQPLTTGWGGFEPNGAWAANQTAIDRNYALPAGAIVDKVGVACATAQNITVKIALENSSTNYTIVVSQTFAHTGSGWEDCVLSSSYTVPATGTYRLGVYAPSSIAVRTHVARSFCSGNATGTVSMTADTNECPLLRALYRTGANNMTLIPAPFTPAGTPTRGDIYILHKAVDAVTLGTDVKIRATGNGGTDWSDYATISAVCDFDASYKFLKASATLPVAGTQVKWEITTYNTKAQQVRAVLVEAS